MAETLQFTSYEHEDAWDVNWLRVDDTHELYYQQFGKKDGKPVIYLHGGPGGNCSKTNTVFFNPSEYRVVLLDQRGCGQSRPNANTTDNTTWHLVEDIEKLRKHLKFSKWHMVFGGSWGSTLALAYAQTHPDSVGSLVLRGIFTVRDIELKWTNHAGGAQMLFPDRWEDFIKFLPEEERSDHIGNYHKRLMSSDSSISHPAAEAWNTWELSISTLYPDPHAYKKLKEPAYLLAHARMEIHYFINKAWMEDGQLLRKENVDRIRNIPTTIVQGRYDVVCPPVTAWELYKQWPESKLHFIDDAGHSVMEPGTRRKLTEVCDEYLSAASFPFHIPEGPPSEPVPSSDITLNALVQHGVHKMDCDRAFLSLIDNRNQFICAEMTRHQSLSSADPAEPLLLGTSRIALEWGVCPFTMCIFQGKPVPMPESPYIIADKSYFCIKDFRQVPTFAERPFVAGYPHMVSYLEIPLFAMSGHILGSYCVVDTKERDFLHPKSLSTLRETTSAISAYLDMRRAEACKSRSAEMMQGLRRFVASDDMVPRSVAPVRPGAHTSQFDLDVFGAASRRKPDKKLSDGTNASVTMSDHVQSLPDCDASIIVSPQDNVPKRVKSDFATQVDTLFMRAADSIGDAMGLDGLVFFDTVSTGTRNKGCQVRDMSPDNTSSPTCDLFAVPLSYYHRDNALGKLKLRQSLIQRLTAKYPRGHVFAVDEHGVFQHDCDDELDSGADDRWNDLFSLLPKTRYVIFLPMFHYSREACYSTCLAWVSDTGKTLDTGDVNSLTAFGNSLMAEVFRLEACENTLSKSDFVSTISHELRSPLHGILASIELIQENCQGSGLMSEISMIESCAVTLLDTFDHLLEYSKVNSRASVGQRGGIGHPRSTTHVHHGAVAVDLASMVEDVIGTVSVGHDHSSRLSSGLNKERQDSLAGSPATAQSEPVVVTTRIEKARDWTFVIDKGAWKRILLNVVSNALKYTKSGYIHVGLAFVEAADDSQSHISLSVTDTGVGMSEDFLKYHLFTPFTQENLLSPGTGLGLSLVKSIVESLHGTISVSSRLGKGTKIIINIPASQTAQRPNVPRGESVSSHECLSGKAIGMLSLSLTEEQGKGFAPSIDSPPEALERAVQNICEDRFGMRFTTVSTDTLPVLDVLLIDHHALSSTLTYDLKTLFPTYTGGTYPVMVDLRNVKGAPPESGTGKPMHTVLVTANSLGPALISAMKDVTTKEKAVPSIELRSRPDMEPTEPLEHADTMLEPDPQTKVLPHRSLSLQHVTLADAATSPALQAPLPTQPPTPLTSSPTCRFRRLLLVDDNPINLKMLCAFAKRLGVPYSSATDGAEAVRLYQTATEQEDPKANYDCIFMDISMPVMDGFQAVSKIRGIEHGLMEKCIPRQPNDAANHGLDGILEDERGARAYIFALTGLGSEKARKQAKNSGFDEFLLKPVRFKDVLPLLARLPTA
ncbi:hypothetical protein J4E85_008673 [Alternaria conjuncta]|uniref:uncharacterized protein n=1 Tax=Alternaria conjuncta TaxID=181017 RepID=UPI002220F2DE|nr:uncharacterized protein J4E85_008673 [Alternaria conjuncta]KAI4921328.1 hypothetical protein J4E85_008673 [Alternaria conjuncta]